MSHKNIYNSKVLCGNWLEERCTTQFDQQNLKTNTYLPNPYYEKFRTVYKDYGGVSHYKRERFANSTDNWLNFQPSMGPKQTFSSTARLSFVKPQEMRPAFQLRHTSLTRNDQKLEEYRARWTKGHADFPRTYLGAIPFKKAEKEQ